MTMSVATGGDGSGRPWSNDVMTAEAQALHAVLADDLDDAEHILRDFLPGELRSLQQACGLLVVLSVDIRHDPVPAPGPVTPSQHGSHPLPPTDASGVAGPGVADAARADRTFSLPPSPMSEGGANAAPPELWVGTSEPAGTNRHEGGRANGRRVGDPRPSLHSRQSRA